MNCKNCEWYKFKDTKDRLLCCCSCELNFHLKELLDSLKIMEIPKYVMNLFIKILSKFQ